MITLLRWLLRLVFRFRAFNESVLKTPGPVLLIPNHLSWIDWLFIGVCLDDDWKFVVSSVAAQNSWLHRKVMLNRRTFPVDTASPYAVKRMAEHLEAGGRLVLFAEGRLSRTGTLMKIFDGTGFLLHKTRAKVITCYVRGAAQLPLSPNPARKSLFTPVTVHFSDVLTPPLMENVKMSQVRAKMTVWLRDRLTEQQFQTENTFGANNLLDAVIEAAQPRMNHVVLEDATRQALTYRKLLVGAELLAGRLETHLGHGVPNSNIARSVGRVGVLLPNVNAMPVLLLALWRLGKVPAVLNFSTGPVVMLACAQLGGLKQIITSRAFLDRAKLKLDPFKEAGIEFIYLEDLRAGISGLDRFLTLLGSYFGAKNSGFETSADSAAVVLFTSGSEGVPKGVELSHGNILANIRQLLAITDLTDADRVFNCLPLFHSFGLSVGTLLPLVRGMYVFLYPSPLHYRVVPTVFYDRDCTVFLSTNTFLNGYARKAHAYDFRSLRYLFAAAEKLQEATAQTWSQKYGVRILEGYGATECAPAICLTTPLAPRYGSVGRLLPGIEYRLESVEGVSEESAEGGAQSAESKPAASSDSLSLHPVRGERRGEGSLPTVDIRTGRLYVRGPNVMNGYLNQDANEKFQALDGWYDTGDIVNVDDDGYFFIRGRMKRFAKVSGEMVSLTAVEDALAGAFPQYGLRCQIAVLSVPDEDKGEKLIAVTNEPKLSLQEIRETIRAKGLSNLCVPREIKAVREIPKLGTGKVNHRELQKVMTEGN